MYLYRVLAVLFILIHLLSSKDINIPNYLLPFIFYAVYVLIWDIYNFSNGVDAKIEIIRKPFIETIAFIVLVHSNYISQKFISNAISIIKYTIIIGFIPLRIFYSLLLGNIQNRTL